MTMNNKDRQIAGSSWLSLAIPKLLGVKYELCTPIIAGQAGGPRTDIVGRSIDLSKPPIDTVFFNLERDYDAVDLHAHWELDYISGDSDPITKTSRKLNNGCLAYWTPDFAMRQLRYDDAIIVKMSEVLGDRDIHSEWLCLRRVGNLAGIVKSNEEEIYVRTSVDGNVQEGLIPTNSIVGLVFGRSNYNKSSRVNLGKTLPFGKEVYTRPNLDS